MSFCCKKCKMSFRRAYVVLRQGYRSINTLKRCQQLKEQAKRLRGKSAIVPFTTVYAFTLPGLGWGKKEVTTEKMDSVVEEKKEIDKVAAIIIEADKLYLENKIISLYDYLIQFKDMENDEVLWRLARAAVDKGKLAETEAVKKALYYEAYAYIQRALNLNKENFAVHKWYAVLLDYTGTFEGTKQRISNSYLVKEHFKKAIELNPKDATSIHSLGYWCYMFADLKWYERTIAAAIYASPPSASYEEALQYFQLAEQTEPNFYSMNLLMLGKTYMKLHNVEMAYTYLEKCREYPVNTPDDKEAHDEAVKLLKQLGVVNKPQKN